MTKDRNPDSFGFLGHSCPQPATVCVLHIASGMESSPRISASSGTYSLVKPKRPTPWGSSYMFSKQSRCQPHHCVFHTLAVILSVNTQKRLTAQSSRAIVSPRSPRTKDHLNGTDFSTSLFSVPLICSSSFHEIQSLFFQSFPGEKNKQQAQER